MTDPPDIKSAQKGSKQEDRNTSIPVNPKPNTLKENASMHIQVKESCAHAHISKICSSHSDHITPSIHIPTDHIKIHIPTTSHVFSCSNLSLQIHTNFKKINSANMHSQILLPLLILAPIIHIEIIGTRSDHIKSVNTHSDSSHKIHIQPHGTHPHVEIFEYTIT